MKIGYARVSRSDPKLEQQESYFREIGVDKIYKDREAGERYALDDLLKDLKPDDVIYVRTLDRLAKSLSELIETVDQIVMADCIILTPDAGLISKGKGMHETFQMLIQFQRDVIAERMPCGLAARGEGQQGGRPRALDTAKQTAIRDMLANAVSEKRRPNFREIGHAIGVSPRTVRRFAAGEYDRAA